MTKARVPQAPRQGGQPKGTAAIAALTTCAWPTRNERFSALSPVGLCLVAAIGGGCRGVHGRQRRHTHAGAPRACRGNVRRPASLPTDVVVAALAETATPTRPRTPT